MVDGRFDGAHEARAHVYPLRAQGQRGRETLSVCEPPGRDERDTVETLSRPRKQDEVRDVAFADVSRAFEAVDGEEIDAEFDGALGVADGGAFVEDGAVGGF